MCCSTPLFEPKSLFLDTTGLTKRSQGACRNGGLFSDKLFRVWEPEFASTIFPITVTSRIPTFRTTPDRMYESGPIRL